MDIIKRMKKDRDYRYRVILLIMIGVLLFSQGSQKKEEVYRASFETCHQYNDMLWTTPWSWGSYTNNLKVMSSTLDKERCRNENGCYVGRDANEAWFDAVVCVPSVPNGWLVESSDNAAAACVSGCFSTYGSGNYKYCKACTPGTECNAAESAIGSVVQSMGLFSDNCKMAYYTVIFGIGILLLIVFAAF